MNITQDDILKDIEEYRQRITVAKSKLALISSGFLPYPAYVKREAKRRELEDDIKHVEGLIKIAKSALKTD